ncbi:MAG: hypothetical protein SGJ10_09070 [Bacteroidota bacterium]|nr:hypothetical protein [Bacteroidota bacterium]
MMDTNFLPFDQVKQLYPNEWVLLGNPAMHNTSVAGGIVIYRSKDKKEVCYIGKDKTDDYSTVTIALAGDINF